MRKWLPWRHLSISDTSITNRHTLDNPHSTEKVINGINVLFSKPAGECLSLETPSKVFTEESQGRADFSLTSIRENYFCLHSNHPPQIQSESERLSWLETKGSLCMICIYRDRVRHHKSVLSLCSWGFFFLVEFPFTQFKLFLNFLCEFIRMFWRCRLNANKWLCEIGSMYFIATKNALTLYHCVTVITQQGSEARNIFLIKSCFIVTAQVTWFYLHCFSDFPGTSLWMHVVFITYECDADVVKRVWSVKEKLSI